MRGAESGNETSTFGSSDRGPRTGVTAMPRAGCTRSGAVNALQPPQRKANRSQKPNGERQRGYGLLPTLASDCWWEEDGWWRERSGDGAGELPTISLARILLLFFMRISLSHSYLPPPRVGPALHRHCRKQEQRGEDWINLCARRRRRPRLLPSYPLAWKKFANSAYCVAN